MKRLMRVEDAFDIAGRGRVLAGIPENDDVGLKAGDRFVLVLSSGERLECGAIAVEGFTGSRAIGVLMTPVEIVADTLRRSELWVGVEQGISADASSERR